MVFASDILSGRSSAAPGFASFLGDMKQKLERRRAYRKTRDELAALSDRTLADLGISRSEITSIARQSAYGPRA